MALCFLQVLREPVVQYLAGSEQRIAPFWNIITWYPTDAPAVLVTQHYATTSQARCCSVLGSHMTGRCVRRPTLFSLWRKARRENSAASRLLGSTSLRFALHGWQRMPVWVSAGSLPRTGENRIQVMSLMAMANLYLQRHALAI